MCGQRLLFIVIANCAIQIHMTWHDVKTKPDWPSCQVYTYLFLFSALTLWWVTGSASQPVKNLTSNPDGLLRGLWETWPNQEILWKIDWINKWNKLSKSYFLTFLLNLLEQGCDVHCSSTCKIRRAATALSLIVIVSAKVLKRACHTSCFPMIPYSLVWTSWKTHVKVATAVSLPILFCRQNLRTADSALIKYIVSVKLLSLMMIRRWKWRHDCMLVEYCVKGIVKLAFTRVVGWQQEGHSACKKILHQ